MASQSRIGPFALEAPLSKRSASGQVFRAVHLEQSKLAAVRVFSIPMGMTPESRRDFATQLEQLKQLRHPGIVRCYGGGFDNRNAYLAYEMIDGESLDRLLKRRGRLPWETVIEYGQALVDALQYAHQTGWIHGRMRPEKLIVPHDGGSICISDFRRDEIASALSGGPPLLSEALYFAPEQFNEGFKPDAKSDLYSLGAVLFTMLTGKPPLFASRIDQLVQLVRSENPASVNAHVLDCPVWLNAIVEQLLQKDPRRRPFGAAAVQLAFREAQRRHASGVGVLQHATAGFSPLQLKADREEAEKVLGIKPKKKRKESTTPFHERPLVLLVGLAACIGLIVWLLMPLSESALRRKAETLLASEEWLDWDSARDEYLSQLLERFPQGKHVEWAREQVDIVDMHEAERRIDRNARTGKEPNSEAERRFIEARQFEQFGDRATALDKYRSIINLLGGKPEDKPILNLARRQIRGIIEKPFDSDELQKFLSMRMSEAESAYASGNVLAAKRIWESILSLYRGNQEMASFVEQAQKRLDSLRERSDGSR